MFRVFTCLTGEHDLRLVVLAGVVCFLASLTAISLFHRARARTSRARLVWIITAGTATGCGIWATHFVAMLAYDPGIAIGYDVILTALSLVAAVIITSIGLGATVYLPTRDGALVGGGVVGAGVASMHYLGMFALEVPGRVTWSFDLVLTSIVLGMLFGAAALSAARREGARATTGAAILLTLAIVSHHFTAMGAVEIIPDPTRFISQFSLSPTTLAIAVASAAVGILGLSFVGAFADRILRERDVQLITAVNNMAQGLIMFDAAERIVVCNDRYIEMYGLSRDIAKPGASLRDIINNRVTTGTLARDPEEYRAALLTAIAKGEITNWVVESPDGRAIAVTNRPTVGGAWIATHEDITERRRAEQRIAYLAHHDALTDLPNRAAFTEHLIETLNRSTAARENFAVLCTDLDRFKDINDIFGHGIGDGLLREVGRRLQVAAEGAFLARLGGDEFTLIATDCADPASISALADRLLTALAEEVVVEGQHLRIGLSIGVAIYPSDGTDAATLIGNADAALYRAKAEGRATIRFFDADMDKKLRGRRALQHDLRSALERGELSLHYQPQKIIGGDVTGFEALLRWQHPYRGSIPPSTFIPLAEESGLIIQIGEWVLREACREAASWSWPLQIAINLSPVQFRHGDLPGLIHSVLLETGLSPGRLELEITEGVMIGDFSRAVSILRRLKSLGVRIAMDDFGTGYSSLSYLQAFPFDKIKIDQSFLSNVAPNSQGATIVRAVIGLARGLGVPVVAEGVETQDQLKFLAGENCGQVQGYLVGRPHPIDHYAELVGRPKTIEQISATAAG